MSRLDGQSQSSLRVTGRPRRARCGCAGRRGVLVAAWAGALVAAMLGAPTPVQANDPDAPSTEPAPSMMVRAAPADGPTFEVGEIQLEYLEPSPDLPALSKLLPLRVELARSETGLVAPRPGEPSRAVVIGGPNAQPTTYHASALGTIARALLSELHDEGLLGVYVEPSAADIDIATERDLREPGDTGLRISIWVGRVKDVRTVAIGDRISDDWIIDNPAHRKIRSYSPLHPPAAGHDDATDLLDRRALEDYIYRLNRHPGRQVEAGLAASEEPGGIDLDYRVYESRAWNAYAQASNTGTERTAPWQTRFGYVNRQTTNRDDILSIEYMNAGGRAVNYVQGSFDAPWFAPKRADWMKSSGKEPPWLAWADRSKVPWWGLGRLRWRLAGGWSRFEADSIGLSDLGVPQPDRVLSTDWNFGGGFRYNFFQHRNLFFDTFVNLKFRGIESVNEANSDNSADVTLIIPEIGIEFDRANLYSSVVGRFWAEHAAPLGDADDYSDAFSANLGRATSDPRWWALHWDFGLSHYLEPLLNPKGWRDPTTVSSSTLSHEVAIGLRGQYAFDYRLIPQAAQVVGGLYSVRGFEQGFAVGDSVYLGSFEYRFHIPRSLPIKPRPTQLPFIGDFRATPQQVYGRPDWDLVLRAFVDAGKSVRNQRGEATGVEFDSELVGVGVGLELNFMGRMRARVDWARGVYQNLDCDETTSICSSITDTEIDPSGKLYFLFSVMY